MGENMQLIGIIPEANLTGEITLDELKCLLSRGLQLDVNWKYLLPLLQQEIGIDRINLKQLYKILNSDRFQNQMGYRQNFRYRSSNLRLIKVGSYLVANKLMGIEDIRSAMQAYCIIEDSDKNCIFPINTNSIKSAFKLMGKTMRTEWIKYWIKHMRGKLVLKTQLMPAEFLLLACNAQDRQQILKKALRNDSTFAQKQGIYIIDPLVKINPQPEQRLQKWIISDSINTTISLFSPRKQRNKVKPQQQSVTRRKTKILHENWDRSLNTTKNYFNSTRPRFTQSVQARRARKRQIYSMIDTSVTQIADSVHLEKSASPFLGNYAL